MEDEGIMTTVPLIDNGQLSTIAATGEDSESGLTGVLAMSTAVAVCCFFLLGTSGGFSSPAEAEIIEDLGLSVAEFSLFASMLTIGGLIGALCSGKICDIIGRKGAMWVTDVSTLVGWLLICLSQNVWMLDTGRLLHGFGVGIATYSGSVYLAEISPENLRGALLSINMLMMACGISIMYIIGPVLNWRLLGLVAAIPCLLQLLGLFYIPESPRWMASRGQEKEVKAALQRLRGRGVDVSKEATDIETYTASLQDASNSKFLDLFQQKYARSLVVGVGMMVLQQFSGLNGHAYYLSSILEDAGASGSTGSMVNGVIQLVSGILAVLLMDKLGRRPLLLVAVLGSCLGNIITGFAFLLQELHQWSNVVPTLAFIGEMMFGGLYSLGVGGIPWVIMSEIFPINVKGSAGTITNLVSWGGSWVVAYTFNSFFDYSRPGVFFFYAGVGLFGAIFVAKMLPETKGQTIEDIDASVNK